MNPLFKTLLWLVPYREETLHLPLSKQAACLRFADLVPHGLNEELPGLFCPIPYQYDIYLDGDVLRAIGPHGNRRWCLVTQGEIQDIPGGSVLRITQRLCTFHMVTALLALGGYLVGAIFFLQFPVEMLPIIVIQVLFLYAVIMAVFQYESDRTLEVLKKIVQN